MFDHAVWYNSDCQLCQKFPVLTWSATTSWGGGELTISTDGTYEFQTRSDDGSIIIIDSNMVVNNDGWHSMRTVAGLIDLNEGIHVLPSHFLKMEDLLSLKCPGGPTLTPILFHYRHSF